MQQLTPTQASQGVPVGMQDATWAEACSAPNVSISGVVAATVATFFRNRRRSTISRLSTFDSPTRHPPVGPAGTPLGSRDR